MLDVRDIWIQMKAILRSARQVINAELASLNLTGAEGDILFHLLSASDGLSQEKLAECLDIDKAAVSRTVNSLDRKGYVHRERQTDDIRAYRVAPTDIAKDVGRRLEYVYNTVFELSLQGIGEQDLKHLSALLEKVYKNLNSRETER